MVAASQTLPNAEVVLYVKCLEKLGHFEYEGQGEQILRAGSCVLQPPGIIHREVRHSDDMELIEIISPADFGTAEEAAP